MRKNIKKCISDKGSFSLPTIPVVFKNRLNGMVIYVLFQDYLKNDELYNFYCKVSNGDTIELCTLFESFCKEDKFIDMIKALSEAEIKELETVIYTHGTDSLKDSFKNAISSLKMKNIEFAENEKILKEYLNL